jgi:hypothetical protein
MLGNAVGIGSSAKDFTSGNTGYLCYYYRNYLEDNNVTVPVFDIISASKCEEYDGPIYSYEGFCEYINSVYVPENIEALRDTLILNIVSNASIMFEDWWGKDKYLYDIDYRFLFVSQISTDVLSA